MASVLEWTEAPESFVALAKLLAKATKLSGRIILVQKFYL